MNRITWKDWAKILLPALLYLLVHMLLRTFLTNTIFDTESLPFASSVTTCLMIPFVVFLYSKENKQFPHFPKVCFGGKAMLELAGVVGCLALSTAFVSRYLFSESAKQPAVSAIEVIGVAIAAPITEELVYRGIVFKQTQKILGCGAALFLSSIVFGAAHIQQKSGWVAMVAGFIFALIYLHYQTIWAAVLVHGGVNALSFWDKMQQLSMIWYLLGVSGLAILVSVWGICLRKQNKKKR